MIYQLEQLPQSVETAVGGKARVLAHLIERGYPVPSALVITADSFQDGKLNPNVWKQLNDETTSLFGRNGHFPALAVRSSAVSEDSAAASFAGEFESILNVRSESELREAIHTVFASQHSQRVVAYSQAKGIETKHEMAVIIQQMVPADLAGVLFTADPISGSHQHMQGNFVHGLGEQLVSGEVTGETFTFERPSGKYSGSADLKPFAKQLYKIGEQLTEIFGSPQDIEWAIASKKLYLLQSRPITTMQPYNPATGEINDSFRGDYLWSNANFGEAIPGIMTPLTWSLVQIFAEETFGNPLPGKNPLMGNIGGRFYMNLSLFASFMGALGMSRERMNRESEEFFGNLPNDIHIPTIPFSRLAVIRKFLPFAISAFRRRRRNLKEMKTFTAELPHKTAETIKTIQSITNTQALANYWQETYEPLLRRAYQMMQAGTSEYENRYRPLRRKLAGQVGESDANLLLSDVSIEGEQLASLGPMIGLWQVANGEMSREAYLTQFGHRGAHEFEVSWPRPAEDPTWFDDQLKIIGEVDVPALLAQRQAEKTAAWERFQQQYPKAVEKTERKLQETAEAARGRESIRSEVTRYLGVSRHFALKAGELTGLNEGTFFLSLEELLTVLEGDAAEDLLTQIPIRQATHERLSQLPPYPALINGRFDPHRWAADPNRRSDIFDTHAEKVAADSKTAENIIQGLPGSAGIVEGIVRKLDNLEDGHLLQEGEILVAVTTNVGWTPLFPRAAAVVTDVGAPLSHAAIVARELGIPAVVGTGNATMKLRTGDHIKVNGATGIIEISA